MSAVPTWLTYSVLRVLMFAVPLVVLILVGIVPWLATILAAVIGLCLSYIFLRAPRERVAEGLHRARHRSTEPALPDETSEDVAADASERERQREQDPVPQPGETGQPKGEDQLP